MNKEDFRVTRTRTSIKKAFLEILDEKAFQDITIKEIADRAQCNRNTFYLHYTDKYDLIDKLCSDCLKNMEQSLYETYEKQYLSKMDWSIDIAKRCLDSIELDMAFYKIVLGKNKYSRFADQFRELLVYFIGSASLKQTGKKTQILEVQFSANGMVGVIRYWLANQTEYLKEDIMEELYNLVAKLGSIIFE